MHTPCTRWNLISLRKQVLIIWMLILFFILYPSPHGWRFQCHICPSGTSHELIFLHRLVRFNVAKLNVRTSRSVHPIRQKWHFPEIYMAHVNYMYCKTYWGGEESMNCIQFTHNLALEWPNSKHHCLLKKKKKKGILFLVKGLYAESTPECFDWLVMFVFLKNSLHLKELPFLRAFLYSIRKVIY